METLEIQDYVMTAQSRAINVWAFAPYYPFAAHRPILHMEKKLKVLPSANTSGG